MGITVSESLYDQFDRQIQSLNSYADSFEGDLHKWEIQMQSEITSNNQDIHKFSR